MCPPPRSALCLAIDDRDNGAVSSYRSLTLLVLPTLTGLLLSVSTARAERQHTVSEGQSLVSIAQGYAVSVSSLAAANERPPSATLRVGEVLSVPEKGFAYLAPGESLWSVARRHGCTVEALARVNGVDVSTTLKPGVKLALPGSVSKAAGQSKASAPAKLSSKAKSASASRKGAGSQTATSSVASGSVALYRVATSERLKLTLTDAKGRVRPQAGARMARFLRPRGSNKQKRPEPRLLALLAEVASHYKGKVIQVMSGYRVAGGYTSGESRHTKGAAMDIRIEGVTNRQLCDYLRHFKNVGVGFYPHSSFVHFDVREKNAYWIDLSGAGNKPSYLDKEQRDHFDGKNKDEGLVELARSVQTMLERDEHGEPADSAPQASDD
ncbi:MAG: LysM-repeat protein [Myxococcaceae bacterium]|nr:LysM-repeat protein [Myxococcaceae bacterium]